MNNNSLNLSINDSRFVQNQTQFMWSTLLGDSGCDNLGQNFSMQTLNQTICFKDYSFTLEITNSEQVKTQEFNVSVQKSIYNANNAEIYFDKET